MCFQQWIQGQIEHHHQNKKTLKMLLVYKELMSRTTVLLSAGETALGKWVSSWCTCTTLKGGKNIWRNYES